MKTPLALLLHATVLAAVAASPEALLDDVLREPGSYNQMCSLPPPMKADVPLPVYGRIAARHFHLSEKNAEKLRAQRAAVVKVLAARLDAMDLSKPPARLALEKSNAYPPPANFTTGTLSGVLLQIVEELQAVEALPGLLKIEAQLAAILAHAQKDPAAPVPELEVDGMWYPSELQASDYVKLPDGNYQEKPRPNAEAIRRQQRMLHCRVYQREVLSLIARLLRDARYQPLLDSDIEQAYAARLKEAAQSKRLINFKKPEDIPAEDRRHIKWDPLYNIPAFGSGSKVELPFTAELRAQIRGFAEQFLATKK